MPDQAYVAPPSSALATAEALTWCDLRTIDIALCPPRDTKDDENLIAPFIHGNVDSGKGALPRHGRP
jgi:hypothetical protein